MKYIDADKLKELIDDKWKELADKNVKVGGGKWDAEISTYMSVLRLIDSLQQEQPEVDLEKEIDNYFGDVVMMPNCSRMTLEKVARRFYELGVNSKKEESK